MKKSEMEACRLKALAYFDGAGIVLTGITSC